MHIEKYQKTRTINLKLKHIVMLGLLMLISCSSLIYKVTHYQKEVVESIITDTVFIRQWTNKTETTTIQITPKQEKQIVNNLVKLFLKQKKKEKLSEWDQFRLEVWNIAGEIKEENNLVNATRFQVYDWTMKLFWHESRFNPKAKNSINAQGLFQAMTFVRKQLKFPSNLYQQNSSIQIQCYKKYINYCLKMVDPIKINSAGDWYMLGLYPSHADKDNNTIFGQKGKRGVLAANYRCNKGLDFNKDGIITKGEIEQKLLSHFQ